MLRRIYSHVAEDIQLCCGGYTAMLWRLYSYAAEAIQSCCGGYTSSFTDNNNTPIKLFWVVWGCWFGCGNMCIELFHKHFVLVPLNIEDKHVEIDQLFLSFSFIKVNKYLTITFPATSHLRFIHLNQNTLTIFTMDRTSNKKENLKYELTYTYLILNKMLG